MDLCRLPLKILGGNRKRPRNNPRLFACSRVIFGIVNVVKKGSVGKAGEMPRKG
jgi:hypothetical protein